MAYGGSAKILHRPSIMDRTLSGLESKAKAGEVRDMQESTIKKAAELIRRNIRDVPDFPKPGILFRDITPVLQNPDAFHAGLEVLRAWAADERPSAVIGIESRGFIFGAPVALALEVPFIPVRKPGKLPAARMQVEYALEYGSGQLDIHADAVAKGDRVVIIDDVLATGGTARGAAKLVEMLGGEVAAHLFLIELKELRGGERLADYKFRSLLSL